MTLGPSGKLLRDRVLAAIPNPLSKIGTEALDSFLALPFVDGWCPNDMYLGTLSSIFNIGLPFALLANNATAESHRREVGVAFDRGECAPASLLSEIHAGALLSNWGGNVRFIPRQARPTPDIEVSWGNEVTLDVEVARGEIRQLHKSVQRGIDAFAGAVQAGDMAWNLVGFIADASDSADLSAMLDAAINLLPGQSAEDVGRWYLRAVALEHRDEVVGANSTELFGPGWWPCNEPSYFVTSTLIGTNSNPVVLLRSLVPLASYMNPILRKATGGQRSPGNPYLIALDVTDLPRAHERIVNDLIGYFEIWDHVSAVLLFEPRFYIGVERKEYVVSIHRNPTACVALPPQLAVIQVGERFSVEFMLSERQE